MQVKNFMTADPACCASDTSLQEVAQLMVDNDCGSIPVLEDKSSKVVIGIVTDRDIVVRAVAKGVNPLDKNAADCLTQPVITVTPDTTLEECARIMEDELVRRLPVIDESGACVGIVSLADIARQRKTNLTAEVVKDLSTPPPSASAAGG